MSKQARKIVLDAILACIGCAGVCVAVWALLPYQRRATISGPFVHESPDSKTLVTLDADGWLISTSGSGPGPPVGPLRIWDGRTGEQRAALFGSWHGFQEYSATRDGLFPSPRQFSSDGRLFAISMDTDTSDRMEGGPVRFASPGRSASQSIQVIDVERGAVRWQLRRAGYKFRPPEFSPDGQLLAVQSFLPDTNPPLHPDVISRENLLQLLEAATGRVVSEFRGHECPLAWQFSPDSTTLALSFQDLADPDALKRSIRLWDVSTRGVRLTMEPATALRGFSPDGKVLVTTSALWDTSTGQERRRFPKSRWNDLYLFSPDSRWLATRIGTADWDLKIWDVATGQLGADLTPPGWVESASFSPDSQSLTAKCARPRSHEVQAEGRSLVVWNTASWEKLAHVKDPHYRDDYASGTLISCANASLRLTNVVTGRERVVFSMPPKEAESWEQLMTADGRTVVVHVHRSHPPGPMITWLSRWLPGLPSASGEISEFRIVDVPGAKEIATIRTSQAAYFTITADDRTLITHHGTAGSDFVQLWDLPPRKPVAWLLAAPIGVLLLGLTAFAGRSLRQRRQRARNCGTPMR